MLASLLRNKAFNGVIWSIFGTAGQTLLQLAVFIVLARKLAPEVFGVVAIASALIDILNLVGRGGLVEVLVQRLEVNERSFNNSFFGSLFIGGVLTGALFLSAPLLAYVFDTAELSNVIRLLAPVCVLFAIGAVYEAKLRRDYAFKQLAFRNVTATIVSGTVALVMALSGFGVYALIAQRLVSTAWNLAAMVIASKWLPKLDVDFRDMVAQLKQGAAIALSSILGAGNQRLIDLIVGYFLGATQLGYLRIAWRILDLLTELAVRPISNVTLTMLANARQRGESINDTYINIIRYGSAFILPVFLGFSAVSHDAIYIIFGPKWDKSGELLAILSLVGVFVPMIYFKTNVLIATGRFRHVLILNSVEFLISATVVSLFAPFGLVSAAAGNVIRTGIATPVILLYLDRVLGISPLRSLLASLPAIASSVGMLFAIYVVKMIMPQFYSPYLSLAIDVSVGGGVFAALIVTTDKNLISGLKAARKS